jgi:integrase
MPTHLLTDSKIRAAVRALPADESKRLNDGEGLLLIARSDGSGLWRFRYRFAERAKMLGLGHWPHTSLALARANRDVLMRQLASGIDPSDARKKQRTELRSEAPDAFESIARQWHRARSNQWTPKHREQVWRSLEVNAFKHFGAIPIRKIGQREIMSALQPMIDRGAIELAARVRQRISEVFEFASTLQGLDGIEDTDWNPARAIRNLLPTPPKRNFPALGSADIPGLLDSITHYRGRKETKLGLQLLMHTFVRPGEMRLAKWSEFAVDQKIWRIPAERMKKRRAHLVPLSDPTLTLLKELKSISGFSDFLFPSPSRLNQPISDATFSKALRTMGYQDKQVAHSFRALASTWLNEVARVNPDAIERQLSHEAMDQVRAAYNRAEYMGERVEMMRRWSEFLEKCGATPVNLVCLAQLPINVRS